MGTEHCNSERTPTVCLIAVILVGDTDRLLARGLNASPEAPHTPDTPAPKAVLTAPGPLLNPYWNPPTFKLGDIPRVYPEPAATDEPCGALYATNTKSDWEGAIVPSCGVALSG